MSETVPNAFLLLLGQIGIFVVSLFFVIPLALISGSFPITSISLATWAFLYVVAVASVMMVANIMIGWNAVRFARQEIEGKGNSYSSRLFVADLLVIFIFFSMNNVIIFALGVGLSAFDPSILLAKVKGGISIGTTSMTLGVLMLLSACYLFVCKSWNREFYQLAAIENSQEYEKRLSHVIVMQTLVGVATLIVPEHAAWNLFMCSGWLLSWVFVNFGWISAGFVK
ncbi:MAG: hypothetical protein AAFQ10_03920 [Pseudomonadota bacterium]